MSVQLDTEIPKTPPRQRGFPNDATGQQSLGDPDRDGKKPYEARDKPQDWPDKPQRSPLEGPAESHPDEPRTGAQPRPATSEMKHVVALAHSKPNISHFTDPGWRRLQGRTLRAP